MKEQNKQSDELIKLFKEALNPNKEKSSFASQQEQIQCIDSKIQEILATRKKYNSLENLHKKQSPLSCLDETKASSSTSSQRVISNKKFKDLQVPRTSDKKFLKEANELSYKPRVIRTTTPYKINGKNCDKFRKNGDKFLNGDKFIGEFKGKFNFDDINKFKRVENDEDYIMNDSIKPKAFGKSEHKNQDVGILPPLEKFNEKFTFTETFNPNKFEKNNGVKHFAVKGNNNGNKQEIFAQTGYFKLEDAVKTKGIFQNKPVNNDISNDDSNEEFGLSKQKNFGKFPKDVFATNVKRKFFV